MDNKRYFWIKLKTDFFNQDTIDFLLSQNNGCEYVVLYQMLCLKTANNNGLLSTQVGEIIVPYDISKIARDTKYFSEDTIRVALELYKQLGLIYEGDNAILKIAGFETMIGSESASRDAIKKREYRLRKKLEEDKKGTNCPIEIEYRDKSIDIDKDIDINIKHKHGVYGRVKLTDKEYNKLVDEYGKEFIDKQIDKVDEYIEMNNNKNKYKNFYLVVRRSINDKWFEKEEKKSKGQIIEDRQNEIKEKFLRGEIN